MSIRRKCLLAAVVAAVAPLPSLSTAQESPPPAGGNTPPPAATSEAAKPETAPAPAPPPAGGDVKPGDGQVGVPEVVVREGKPRPKKQSSVRATSGPGGRIVAAPQPAAAAPRSALARAAPGVQLQPAGQTFTAVSGNVIKDSPAVTVR